MFIYIHKITCVEYLLVMLVNIYMLKQVIALVFFWLYSRWARICKVWETLKRELNCALGNILFNSYVLLHCFPLCQLDLFTLFSVYWWQFPGLGQKGSAHAIILHYKSISVLHVGVTWNTIKLKVFDLN